MPSEKARKVVQDHIAVNKVMVFSKTYCPYCTKAKRTIGMFLKPGQFQILEIENLPDCNDIQDALAEITGARSVPRVFIGGKFIGGGDDTARLASNGELPKLLAAQGLEVVAA